MRRTRAIGGEKEYEGKCRNKEERNRRGRKKTRKRT